MDLTRRSAPQAGMLARSNDHFAQFNPSVRAAPREGITTPIGERRGEGPGRARNPPPGGQTTAPNRLREAHNLSVRRERRPSTPAATGAGRPVIGCSSSGPHPLSAPPPPPFRRVVLYGVIDSANLLQRVSTQTGDLQKISPHGQQLSPGLSKNLAYTCLFHDHLRWQSFLRC